MTTNWETRAVPILRYLAEIEEAQGELNMVSIGQISEVTGIEDKAVLTEVNRLIEGEFIFVGGFSQPLMGGIVSGWTLVRARIGERGARTLNIWPPEDAYAAMLAIIDHHIASADGETASKLQGLKAALGNVGIGAGGALLAQLATQLGHLPH
jgi:hypothetical protein